MTSPTMPAGSRGGPRTKVLSVTTRTTAGGRTLDPGDDARYRRGRGRGHLLTFGPRHLPISTPARPPARIGLPGRCA